MNRFQEPGGSGLLCDLLWSDPIANYGHEQEPTAHGPGLAAGTTFLHNATRGCSFFFTLVVAFVHRYYQSLAYSLDMRRRASSSSVTAYLE
jgi:serine/threonine-protein phosphatase 2B catalytic subunit